jgi:hypothetical protein
LFDRNATTTGEAETDMDDELAADLGDGLPLIPPPPLRAYLRDAASTVWTALYFGATYGVLLWGTIGGLIGALCGAISGGLGGSAEEAKSQAIEQGLAGVGLGGIMIMVLLSIVFLIVSPWTTRMQWEFMQTRLAKWEKLGGTRIEWETMQADLAKWKRKQRRNVW